MGSFGVGVYFLTIIWFITFMLCWVSVRTGHYIGKIAIGGSFFLTIILVSLPRGDVEYTYGANYYDKLFVMRYAVLSVLLLSILLASVYCFVSICLVPLETRKVRSFGCVN